MSDQTSPDTSGETGPPGQTGQPGQPQRPPLSARAAAEVMGVNERTIRRWLDEGRISAPKVRGAYRFDLDELDRARLLLLGEDKAGNIIIEAEPEQTGHDRTPEHDRSARSVADAASAALSVSALSQFETIRDEWLQPLIDQLSEKSEEIGRLKAERDAAITSADRLREENAFLRAVQDRAQPDIDPPPRQEPPTASLAGQGEAEAVNAAPNLALGDDHAGAALVGVLEAVTMTCVAAS